MATRKKGMRNIPNALNQGKNVFPITRFGAKGSVTDFTVGGAGNEREVIDLDLQFEDNEVFDIWCWEVHFSWDLLTTPTQASDISGAVAMFEDPDKAVTTDLYLEATWEDDNSLIDMGVSDFARSFSTAAGFEEQFVGERRYFEFPQPYTVARNICLIFGGEGTEGDATTFLAYAQMWGRRRNATDAEFKNIIYRQRF